MAKLLVGVDVGTTGTKSVVMDDEGRVLGYHYVEYPLHVPRPGWAEQDPDDYWRAVQATVRVALRRAHADPRDVRGVSVSALAPACILLDQQGRPLERGHIWMDRRGTSQADWLKEHIGADRIFELSGNVPDPYFAMVKLMWERDVRPDLYRQTFKLQTAADYPVFKLTGQAVTDYSNASLIGIAFDIRRRTWDLALLEQIGIDPDKLPTAYPCDQVIGEVTRAAAEETGLLAGTPVVAGTVDCNAAWLGRGAVQDQDAGLVMGTAGVLGVVHDTPSFCPSMITIVHGAESRTRYTTLGALVSCGSLMRYYRDTFAVGEMAAARDLGLDAYDLMNLEAQQAPPGSDGLLLLPYFMGERTPVWDPLARGVALGWSIAHRRGHMIRAMMEGPAFALRQNLEVIRGCGLTLKEPLLLSEGGAKSRLWRQIIADTLGMVCSFSPDDRGAPVGNAVVAGVGVGVFKDYTVVKSWPQRTEQIVPDPDTQAVYDRYYEVFRGIYPRTRELFVQLAQATGYR